MHSSPGGGRRSSCRRNPKDPGNLSNSSSSSGLKNDVTPRALKPINHGGKQGCSSNVTSGGERRKALRDEFDEIVGYCEWERDENSREILNSSKKDITNLHKRSKKNREETYSSIENIDDNDDVQNLEPGLHESGSGDQNKYYTIAQMKQYVECEREVANLELKDVTLVSADIYRYMGCPNRKCQKSLWRHEWDFYYCTTCTRKFTYDERQIYMILRNITLSDQSGILRNGVCFNNECENLLGKKADYFKYDEWAKAWLTPLVGSRMNLEISIKEASNKRFPMNIIIEAVTVVSSSSESLENRICRDGTDAGLEVATGHYENMSMYSVVDAESKSNYDSDSSSESLPEEPFYNLDSNPSGLVLIINNTFSGVEGRERYGSEFDIVELEKIFVSFNFEVCQDEIACKVDLENKLRSFQRKLTERDISCSIVVMMSHGTLNNIELTNNECANIWTDVVDKFSDSSFPAFRGRPKIFIFNACQTSSRSESDIKCSPVLKDTMVILPGIPGNYTYRYIDEGSFFIQNFVKVLKKYGTSRELSELVIKTQRRMSMCPIEGTADNKTNRQQCYCINLLFQPFRFSSWLPSSRKEQLQFE